MVRGLIYHVHLNTKMRSMFVCSLRISFCISHVYLMWKLWLERAFKGTCLRSLPLAWAWPAMASMMASCEYMLMGVLYWAWMMVALPPGPFTSIGLWVDRAESFSAIGLKLGTYSWLSENMWIMVGGENIIIGQWSPVLRDSGRDAFWWFSGYFNYKTCWLISKSLIEHLITNMLMNASLWHMSIQWLNQHLSFSLRKSQLTRKVLGMFRQTTVC